jgi:hypothetical protein
MFFLKIKKIISVMLLVLALKSKANAHDNSQKSSNVKQYIESIIAKRSNKNRPRLPHLRESLNLPTIKPHNFKSKISMVDSRDFPAWITGFTDGEGCFSISITQRQKNNFGLDVQPSFSIGQKSHSKESLKKIQEYFGCGFIRPSQKDGMYKYEVRSIKDLVDTIIPFFNKNTLETAKLKDFHIFEECCREISQGQHLNEKGLKKIIENTHKMNPSGKRKYTKEELIKIIDKQVNKKDS